MMLKNKRILILGVGNVGEAVAVSLAKEGAIDIALHCLTEKEVNAAISNIKDFLNGNSRIEFSKSFGNILTLEDLKYKSNSELKQHYTSIVDKVPPKRDDQSPP